MLMTIGIGTLHHYRAQVGQQVPLRQHLLLGQHPRPALLPGPAALPPGPGHGGRGVSGRRGHAAGEAVQPRRRAHLLQRLRPERGAGPGRQVGCEIFTNLRLNL